MSTSDRYKK